MPKKKLLLIVSLIILIFIASGSAWYLFNGGKDTEGTGQNSSDTTNKETPASTKDLATLIEENKLLSSFDKLLTISGVITTLKSAGASGQMTYIAIIPNNEAVKKLPSGYYDSLLTAQRQSSAIDIAKYHVAQVASDTLVNGQKLKTVEGQEVIVGIADKQYSFTDAKGTTAQSIKPPQKSANGTLFIINNVLLPQ